MIRPSRSISTACSALLLGALVACGGRGGDGMDTPVEPDPMAVASLEIDPLGHNFIAIGESQKFIARARNYSGDVLNDQAMVFTSSSPLVASVSSSGVVTSVGPGAATITATLRDGAFSAAASVTVWQAVASFTMSPKAITLLVGESQPIAVTATDRNGFNIESPTLTFESRSEAIATVSSNGLITGVSPGTATITASSNVQLAGIAVTVVPRN